MTRFHDTLAPLRPRLTIEPASREAILAELESDLDGIFRHHVGAGRTETEARALAIEACDLSDEALAELVSVHTSGIGRVQDALARRTSSTWERRALVGVSVAALALLGFFLSSQPVLADAGPGGWAVLTLLVAALARAVVAARRLPDTPGSPAQRRALGAVLVLGGWQVAAGSAGWWLQLYLASRSASDAPDALGRLLTGWLLSGAALMSLTSACVLITVLAWHAASRAGLRTADLETVPNPTDKGEPS